MWDLINRLGGIMQNPIRAILVLSLVIFLSPKLYASKIDVKEARAHGNEDPVSSALRIVSNYDSGTMDPALLEKYLEQGVPVNLTNEGGATLLNLAVESYAYLQEDLIGNQERLEKARQTIDLLLRNGADASIPDNSGMTPLMHLFRYGGPNISELFQAILATSPNLAPGFRHNGFSIIHFAAAGGRPEILNLLIERPDLTGNLWKRPLKDGRNILHFAATSRLEIHGRILIEFLANRLLTPAERVILIDFPDHAGRTPLLNAVRTNNLKAVQYLLENFKLKVNRKSTDGDTPLMAAQENRNDAMIELLKAHGAVSLPYQEENQIFCDRPNEGRVSFQFLKQLIENCNLKTIDSVLAQLPLAFRSNHTFAYSTEAAQKASPDFPQTILFGRDGKLLLAFNGDPKLPGYRSIETIEFKENTKTFELREIEFSNSGVVFSEANPQKCLNCHGVAPKPLWDNWTFWPGKFRGEMERFYSKEWSFYQRFQKNRLGNRYRHIPAVSTRANISSMGRYGLGDNANIKMDEITIDLVAQQAVEQMKKMPDFSKIKYSILASLSCSDAVDQYISEPIRVRLKRDLQSILIETTQLNLEEFDRRYERLKGILNSLPEGRYVIDQKRYGLSFPNSAGRNFDIERTSRLRYLFEGLNYSIEPWFPEFNLRLGDRLRYVAGNLGYLEAHAWLNLLDDTVPVDRELRKVVENLRGRMGHGSGGFLQVIYGNPDLEKTVCPTLKNLVND